MGDNKYIDDNTPFLDCVVPISVESVENQVYDSTKSRPKTNVSPFRSWKGVNNKMVSSNLTDTHPGHLHLWMIEKEFGDKNSL